MQVIIFISEEEIKEEEVVLVIINVFMYVFMYVKQNQEEKGNEHGSFIFINLAFVILFYLIIFDYE